MPALRSSFTRAARFLSSQAASALSQAETELIPSGSDSGIVSEALPGSSEATSSVFLLLLSFGDVYDSDKHERHPTNEAHELCWEGEKGEKCLAPATPRDSEPRRSGAESKRKREVGAHFLPGNAP